MQPTITAFKASPDKGRGLARDMPVRWALEEVGQAYETRLVTFEEMKQPRHLARQPFGPHPVPTCPHIAPTPPPGPPDAAGHGQQAYGPLLTHHGPEPDPPPRAARARSQPYQELLTE